MSEAPEDRSTAIIAEAEALIEQAQASMARTQALLQEAGYDPDEFNEAMASLSAEDREFVAQATKELVAHDLGLPQPAETAPRPKKPRNMI